VPLDKALTVPWSAPTGGQAQCPAIVTKRPRFRAANRSSKAERLRLNLQLPDLPLDRVPMRVRVHTIHLPKPNHLAVARWLPPLASMLGPRRGAVLIDRPPRVLLTLDP
jgi:hypothetical protein